MPIDPSKDPEVLKLQQDDAAALADFTAPQVETPPVEVPPVEPPKLAEGEKKVDEKPAEAPPEKDEIDKKLEEIQPSERARPNTVRDIMALKEIIVDIKGQLKLSNEEKKGLADKLVKIEDEYKGKVLTPEIEAELKEWHEYRRAYQIEKDPEFQAKYSNKLREIDGKAVTILRSSGMKPDLEKFIMDNGGVMAMYNSAQQMPAPHQDKTYQEFVETVLMPRLQPIQKTRLEQAIGAGMDLREEMSREIEYSKTHGSELQQKKQKEIEDKFRASAVATRESLGEIAKKLEYPDKANDDQKKKIDKHNALVEKAEKVFEEYVAKGGDPAIVAEAFAKASANEAAMEKLLDAEGEISGLREQLKKVEERLAKVKGSGATGRETAAPPSDHQPPQTGKIISDNEALDSFVQGK